MTQERELEIEGRITALETQVRELARLVQDSSAFWRNFFGSATGGIVVGVVVWLVTKG